IELTVISWIRHHYMDTPLLSAIFQVVLGGVLVFITGILIGSALLGDDAANGPSWLRINFGAADWWLLEGSGSGGSSHQLGGSPGRRNDLSDALFRVSRTRRKRKWTRLNRPGGYCARSDQPIVARLNVRRNNSLGRSQRWTSCRRQYRDGAQPRFVRRPDSIPGAIHPPVPAIAVGPEPSRI